MIEGEKVKRSPPMYDPVIPLYPYEQPDIFDALVNRVALNFETEAAGTAPPEVVERNNRLRVVIKRLAGNLEYDPLTPQEWLAIGIADFVSDEILEQYAQIENPTSDHQKFLSQRAKKALEERKNEQIDLDIIE